MPMTRDAVPAGGTGPERHGSFLETPGAGLYYQVEGTGPLLVLVPGAAGSVEPYRRLADELESHYRVLSYDRRGFSRSALVGDQDYGRRLETDASDVRALIEHVGNAPAVVFGNSSGAIVALEVLVRHPSAVRLVVAHEAPVMLELPDGGGWEELSSSLYDLYRRSGPGPALVRFRETSFPDSDRTVMARVPANEFTAANGAYWFEHELRQYPSVRLDHEALCRRSDRLVLAVGRDSDGYPCCEATRSLGRKLGRMPLELPGGHVGFVSQAPDFARCLIPHLGVHPSAPATRGAGGEAVV